MKNKNVVTELPSFKLSTRYLAAPHQFIEEFVFDYKNYSALNTLKNLFLATTNRKKRKKIGSASDILFFCEQLEKLMEACWLILQTDPEGDTGWIPMEFPDENSYFNFFLFAQEKEKFLWSVMPRHLDELEFRRPVVVFQKFYHKRSLSEWKELLNQLLHTVLSKSIGDLSLEENNPVEQYLHFAGLIEASYLIHIRRKEYYLQNIKELQEQQVASTAALTVFEADDSEEENFSD